MDRGLSREQLEELVAAYRLWQTLGGREVYEAYKAVGYDRFRYDGKFLHKEDAIVAYYRLKKPK